jgi:deoxyribodipyrimidine photolyase-related protein
MDITLIFPHQLYAQHPAIEKGRAVYLVEDPLYFTQYPFHQQKLVLHRASMKYYQHHLEKKGYHVTYVNAADADLKKLFLSWKKEKVNLIHYADTIDYLLERRIQRNSTQHHIALKRYDSPNFLTTETELQSLFAKEKKYLMANFYIKQRKRLDILVEHDAPVGGQWSFDADNRQKVPKGLKLPAVYAPKENEFVAEAKIYVAKYFKKHYGEITTFPWPTTHLEAEKVLEDFLLHRMKDFGAYEDAIVKHESILFHSVLTPSLNSGLLTPQQIIDRTFELHKKLKFPLNSLEGFIRQIIGWREFMRAIYLREGVKQRTANAWGFTRKIPKSFYDGTTGIEPIDQTIKKILKTGYCHHIERLMVLGNFMHLCEFDPDEVYRWFMELFIDAYDWVMVPNIYGMSQYADGGMMTTKPYVSGSNYILKMSDYTKGPWCEVWDGLYWRYIDQHKELFAKNPRMSMIVNLVKKMDPQKLKTHRQKAEQFLNSL